MVLCKTVFLFIQKYRLFALLRKERVARVRATSAPSLAALSPSRKQALPIISLLFSSGVDTPLSSFPRGLLSLGESPLGVLFKKAGFNSREKLATSKEDTMENLEMEIITATKVADEDRLNFWLRHVGMAKMLAFERHVYCWMRRLCPHYDGGYWNFYDLSNGGFYIAPADEKKMWLTWPGNYFNDEMSADAAGIVVTLYALNDFAEQISPAFGEKHRQLYDYIESHPEAQAIYAAID